MFQLEAYQNLGTWLDRFKKPVLLTHRGPDGDALGALAGLHRALRQRGADPTVALYEPLPPRYVLLEHELDWRQWKDVRGDAFDAALVVDTCSWSQLEPVADWLRDAPPTAVVDHHATTDDIGTRDGDLRLIDPTAAATCVLIWEWCRAARVTRDGALARALFTGTATDTGWFRFSNTDERTLTAAAEMVGAGARPNEVYGALYEQDSAARLRLVGRMLSGLELRADGRLAVLQLRQGDFAAAGADESVTEDLVNEATRLAGVVVTLLFTERPAQIRVNFRSKRDVDVAALAREFGGGGHVRAAGARLSGRWDDEVARVVAAAEAALG